MTPATDPRIERLLAAQEAREQAEQQASDDAEHARAARQLSALNAEEAAERPALEAKVRELQRIAHAANDAAFAAAATCELKVGHWGSKRVHLWSVLARTMPAGWRAARAEIEERIAAEQARIVGRPALPLHEACVRGLQAARDALDVMAELPVEDIPARIEAVLAAVPPRYNDEPVTVKPWIQQMGENLRAGIAARFGGH